MDDIKKIEPEEVIITETHSSPEPMRQPDFKCEREKTEDIYRDFYETMSYRRIALSTAIIFACCAILLAVSLILNRRVTLLYFILVAVYFVFIAIFYFRNRSIIKKTLERIKYMSGGEFPPLNEYFFADEIVTVNEDPDKTKEFSYADIKSVKESGIQYLLEMKLNLFLMAPKDMENASGVSFDKYILEKATGLKKKKIGSAGIYRVIFDIFFVLTALVTAASVILYFVI